MLRFLPFFSLHTRDRVDGQPADDKKAEYVPGHTLVEGVVLYPPYLGKGRSGSGRDLRRGYMAFFSQL